MLNASTTDCNNIIINYDLCSCLYYLFLLFILHHSQYHPHHTPLLHTTHSVQDMRKGPFTPEEDNLVLQRVTEWGDKGQVCTVVLCVLCCVLYCVVGVECSVAFCMIHCVHCVSERILYSLCICLDYHRSSIGKYLSSLLMLHTLIALHILYNTIHTTYIHYTLHT